MGLADEILNTPGPICRRHWFYKLTEEQQIECLIIWDALQHGKTQLAGETLGQRIKEAFDLDVTYKQAAEWLRDKKGWNRATEEVQAKARQRIDGRG